MIPVPHAEQLGAGDGSKNSEGEGRYFMRAMTMLDYGDIASIPDQRDRVLAKDLIHTVASIKPKARFSHAITSLGRDRFSITFKDVGDVDLKCLERIMGVDSRSFIDISVGYPVSWDVVPQQTPGASPDGRIPTPQDAQKTTSASGPVHLTASLWSHGKGRENMTAKVHASYARRPLSRKRRAIEEKAHGRGIPEEDASLVRVLEEEIDGMRARMEECAVEVKYDGRSDAAIDSTFDIVVAGLESVEYSFLEHVMRLFGVRLKNIFFSCDSGVSKTRFEMYKGESREDRKKVPVRKTLKRDSHHPSVSK
jgi:hypothetical protein